jgi:hypothetical protein
VLDAQLCGGAVEVERTVNAVGLIGFGAKRYCIGNSLAGLRVTLRLDGTVMHILDRDRALLATLPCPVPNAGLGRLQGAHPAGPPPTAPLPAPVTVERIVTAQGTFMLGRQKITVGKQHARAVVQVTTDGDVIQVFHAGTLIRTVALNRLGFGTGLGSRPAPVGVATVERSTRPRTRRG